MKIQIIPQNNGKIKRDDFAKIEKRIKKPLPNSYVDIISKIGNAPIQENMHKVFGEVSLEYFFMPTSLKENILEVLDFFSDRIPSETIPIGQAAGGSLILLNVIDGSIIFWDHEKEDFSDNPKLEAPCLVVAKSLQEFLDDLKPLEKLEGIKVISVKFNPEIAKKYGL